jgi:hypothetical protein
MDLCVPCPVLWDWVCKLLLKVVVRERWREFNTEIKDQTVYVLHVQAYWLVR